MIEIITSWGFTAVVNVLDLRDARCTYIYTPSKDSYWPDPFAVWEFTESEFNKLNDAFTEDEWQERFPGQWWRYSEDTNIKDDPDYFEHEFKFHGKPLRAWANSDIEPFYIEEDDDGQQYMEERDYNYLNPLEYCVQEIGVSTPKNVDAVCHGLARLNNMTLADFFEIYMEAPNE